MLKVSDYKWKSAEAEKLFSEGSVAVTRGWTEVELYGHGRLARARADFDAAAQKLERALELEGESHFPLIYKDLARAYAGLALHSDHARQARAQTCAYADKSIAYGREAISRYDKSEGWDHQGRSGFHVSLAIAYSCRHDIASAEEQLAAAERFGDLGNMGALWLKKLPGYKRKLGPRKDNKRCFIATAACGSADAPGVVLLRRFRDDALLTTAPGRVLVRAYYCLSPRLARVISANDGLRRGTRTLVVGPAVRLARRYLAARRRAR